jgi:hypothetical protein
LAIPALAGAQTQLPPPPPPPPASSAGGISGGALAVIGLLALLVLVAVAVKLYDAKRKRENEGVVLQARLSDSLMLDSRLSGVPVVASVHVPLWRGAPPVVEVSGAVPSPELRDTAIQLIKREMAGSPARIEDLVVVDPRKFERVA